MDDDDWDLHAVVKSCATVSGTAVNNSSSDYLAVQSQEETEFDFPGLLVDDRSVDPFEDLQEIYREFCVDPEPSTTVVVDSATVGHISQPHHGMEPMQRQGDVQFKNPGLDPGSTSLPVVNSQSARPRRRKNQQMKMVREMTQEELSADSWAWRKYGQKPIKGSPYPRNYYRCSTSKGCAARKQVERSPNDPLIFIVSYTGEHTHPRPTHRSSLAGSTRNKLSPAAAAKDKNTTTAKHLLQNGSLSSSSPASGSSFSPSSPLMRTMRNDVVEMDEDGGDEAEEDDNNVKIPNDDDEDIFKMFQDSDHSSGGGDHLLSNGLLSSPPWTPTSSIGGGGAG